MPGQGNNRPRAALTLAALVASSSWSGCQFAGWSETARAEALYAEEWEERLREDPLLASSVGRHEYDERLPRSAPEDEERRGRSAREFRERLRAIDPDQLDEAARVDYEVFEHELAWRAANHEFAAWQMPLLADSGFHIDFADLPRRTSFASVRDYDCYIARLREFPRWVEEHVRVLREGIASGRTLPRVVMDGYEATATAHVVGDPEQSVFDEPLRSFPEHIPTGERERLRTAGRAAIEEAVVPAYARFADFLREEYVPRCRATIAAADLPDGRAWYEHLVRHFTTLDLAPEEVHAIGREEVERIEAEMNAIRSRVGFEGDLRDFLEHLREEPRFYAPTPRALLERASFLAKQIDGKLPQLFRRLPRMPYGVAPVPDAIAPRYTAGRYVPPPSGGSEPGYYWVNTYALESRPLYALPALTLHEAVPGHHLQMSLAAEQADVPEFRRHAYIDAYGEGWALYAERLGLEVGIYEDPYDDFGRLTYEMWRACRLVVDTGIHAMGWTREQAIEYLAGHTALSLHEVRTETDRYISWPGQALAYKIGELAIRRLRTEAEAALGERFDRRDFHDLVLRHGALPLRTLERIVREWISERRRE